MNQRLIVCAALCAVTLSGCTKVQDVPSNSSTSTIQSDAPADHHEPSRVPKAEHVPSEEPEMSDAMKAENARKLVTDVNIASRAVRDFGVSMFHERVKKTPNENIALSPWSIESALIMTAAGAHGDTLAQMLSTLGFKAFPDSPLSMQASFEALHESLLDQAQQSDKSTSDQKNATSSILHAANAVWVASQLRSILRPEFVATLHDYHKATIQDAPFTTDPESARKTINRWVSDHTVGKIPQLMSPGTIAKDTSLVLTNAVYFNATWTHAFHKESTRDEAFYLENGRSVMVPMMHQRLERATYWSKNRFRAIELPYEKGAYAMRIVVPEAGEFKAVRDTLVHGGYDEIFSSDETGSHGLADVALPRFKFQWAASLNQTLTDMGMAAAFDGRANFSGMFQEGSYAISDVVHKVYIDVDERGTTAAAATGVVIRKTTAQVEPPRPFSIRADRPFLFVIHDTEHGTPVFIGQVMNPDPS